MSLSPFKRHRFPATTMLLAVRWYCRYSLSYREVSDLLAERKIFIDASTIYRWVQKFGPKIASRTRTQRSWRGLDWYVDETYIRVGGKWRYLWRAVDQHNQYIDSRLTAKRDFKAANAFIRRAIDNARIYTPCMITTDKAPTYGRVLLELNRDVDPLYHIKHVNKKWKNNRIESDHAALKKRLTPMRGFKSLASAKATISGIEAIRMIKKGHVHQPINNVADEQRFIERLFGIPA